MRSGSRAIKAREHSAYVAGGEKSFRKFVLGKQIIIPSSPSFGESRFGGINNFELFRGKTLDAFSCAQIRLEARGTRAAPGHRRGLRMPGLLEFLMST